MTSLRLTALNQLTHRREIVDGAWELTPRHQVRYRRRGREETVVLTADLVAAEPAGLTVQVTGDQLDGDLVGQTLTLRGRWQADAANRLTFLVERERGRFDRLILGGGWGLGPHQELLYRVQRTDARGRPIIRTLTFRGAWELPAGRQLTYLLEAASDSAFRFRGAFQTPSVLAKAGELRYQLGAEAGGRRGYVRTITLFGKWKLSRDLALSFELPVGQGRPHTMRFDATYALGPRQTVTAALAAGDGRPLGLEVIFSRQFLQGQGEAFVRLRRALEESAVEAGLRVRW